MDKNGTGIRMFQTIDSRAMPASHDGLTEAQLRRFLDGKTACTHL
jgi:hypothetical protein